MLKGYPLRKYELKDWLLIILTSSLFLQLVVTALSVKAIDFFPETVISNIQIDTMKQLIYFSGFLGTSLSLPLTIIVVIKRKMPLFNRKRLNKKESFIIRGLNKKDWKFLITYIPVSFLVFNIGNSIIVNLFGEGEAVNQIAIETMFNYLPLWQMFLMTVIVAPVVEEILFRGLILFSNGKIETSWFRVILSALLFGLVHSPTDIPSIYNYVGMGLIFSYAAKRTKTIEGSMIYHFLNNLLGFIAILLYS